MKTPKARHEIFLPTDVSDKLKSLAAKPGTTQTAIVTDALRSWFDRRGANELDDRFGLRLDRLSNADARLERKLDFVAEALGAFIQHQLTLTAHHPTFENETSQLGMKRYHAFVEMIGRRLVRPDQSPIAAALTEEPQPKE